MREVFLLHPLFATPIIVDSPISCIVIDVPAPVLLLSTPSLANDLHSAPVAALPSDKTIPHDLQTTSPELSSVINAVLLQDGHLCSLDDFNYFDAHLILISLHNHSSG